MGVTRKGKGEGDRGINLVGGRRTGVNESKRKNSLHLEKQKGLDLTGRR